MRPDEKIAVPIFPPPDKDAKGDKAAGKLEGEFAIPTPQMIEVLNLLLGLEYNSWLTYVHYSQTIRGPYRESIAKIFQEHAEEELKHADALARRIVTLGGIPTTDTGTVPDADSLEKMIENLVRQEQTALKVYRETLKDVGDNEGLRQHIENIIDQEQEHSDELWLLLPETPVISPLAFIESKLSAVGAKYVITAESLPRLSDFLISLERYVNAASSESNDLNVPGSPYLCRITRDDGYSQVFEIAKFDGHDTPSARYNVTCSNKRGHKEWRCNCPGATSHGECKHVAMVQKWDKAGRKMHPAFSSLGISFKSLMDALRNDTGDPMHQSHKTHPKRENANPRIPVPNIVKKPKLDKGSKKTEKVFKSGPVAVVPKKKQKLFRLKPTK